MIESATVKIADIPLGRIHVLELAGLRIALCHTEHGFYAVEDVCTHDEGPLAEGRLAGYLVECPRHGARFDVRTGAVARMPAVVPVRTFPVRVEGDSVRVDVDVNAGVDVRADAGVEQP